jgi:hypothetical protein
MESVRQNPISVAISFPYWTAYLATIQLIVRTPLQLAVSTAFPIAVLYFIYLSATHGHRLRLTDIAVLIACFFFTPLTTALSLFLRRRHNPLTRGPFMYTFDADGIHASNDSFSMSVRWSTVKKVLESGRFIFFFITPARAYSVPLAQLKAAGCLDEVRALAQSKVNPK